MFFKKLRSFSYIVECQWQYANDTFGATPLERQLLKLVL